MTDRAFNVLVPCTGNPARSIMAGALIDILGDDGRFATVPAAIRTSTRSAIGRNVVGNP